MAEAHSVQGALKGQAVAGWRILPFFPYLASVPAFLLCLTKCMAHSTTKPLQDGSLVAAAAAAAAALIAVATAAKEVSSVEWMA
eukprot:scaffold19831_cov19-Tisochrysis_lutea.AAC.1